MKKDKIYPHYLIYLESKLLTGLSVGAFRLLKISKSAFEDFKYRFENDELFHKKQLELYKSEARDKKIDDLFDDIS